MTTFLAERTIVPRRTSADFIHDATRAAVAARARAATARWRANHHEAAAHEADAILHEQAADVVRRLILDLRG